MIKIKNCSFRLKVDDKNIITDVMELVEFSSTP